MTPTAKQEFQTQQRIKDALEEIYLRILLNDNTTSMNRKLRVLDNLFNDGTPSTLTVVHMEVFDKVRHMMKVMKENGVEVTYGALLLAGASHKNHHAPPQNRQDFPCETRP